jgi:hypothetical protein
LLPVAPASAAPGGAGRSAGLTAAAPPGDLTVANLALVGPGGARPVGAGTIVVRRDQPPVTVLVPVRRAGEAAFDLIADAPGVSWAATGRESAVVSVDVDGRYATDLVVTSARRTPRSLALGHLAGGVHRLTLRFAADRSPAGASRVQLRNLRLSVAAPGRTDAHLARRHAPVLFGRVLPEHGTVFQNAVNDTPLLAWHEIQALPTPGLRRIVYSIIWSNEDGGTDSPALMARWGRTTDIEWVYAVDVTASGDRVPGQAYFHGPGHQTLPFAGRYEGDHPLLQTCTVNNTVCDHGDGPMRFFLAADQVRPERRARECLMDTNPWTYPVMAEELEREGKIENPSDPATPEVGDQRTYLYLEVDKDTAAPPAPGGAPGVAVLVRLRGDATVYRSDHGRPSWSIARDDPAATTVELPAGKGPADVVGIAISRVPVTADNQAAVTVTDVNRAFFLGRNRLPQPSFVAVHGLAVRLTAEAPTATVWGSPA